MAETHTARAHAKLSPSAAHRWFPCPGSIVLSASIPNKSSVFADEGTAAHELAQHCLTTGFDADRFLGMWVNIDGKTIPQKFTEGTSGLNDRIFPVTDEMAESVQEYVDECRSFMVEGAEWEIEAKLDLRHIPGMEFGTGDFVCYQPAAKKLIIRDLKYGRGVPVEAEGNEQLLVYAEGTAKRYHNRGLETVSMGIVQPRCPHVKGSVREHTIDALDLAEFRFTLTEAAEQVAKAAKAFDSGSPIPWDQRFLHPGDHCKFCPAAPTCPALRSHSLKTAEMEFTDAPPPVSDLSAERVAEILSKAETIEGWVKRVKAHAHEMASQGDGVPGWKLVHSTSHRKFKDEVTPGYLSDMLGVEPDELMTDPKLKSPAQVESLNGKKRAGEIKGLVFKPRGKVILVPEADPRDTVKPDAEGEFAS